MEQQEQKTPTYEEMLKLAKTVATTRATKLILERHKEELATEAKAIFQEIWKSFDAAMGAAK